jgi:hypothetical protein
MRRYPARKAAPPRCADELEDVEARKPNRRERKLVARCDDWNQKRKMRDRLKEGFEAVFREGC